MTSTLADLQRRNIEQMGTSPVDTESRTPVLTEVSEQVIQEASTDANTQRRASARTGVSKAVTKKARADADGITRQEASIEKTDFLAAVNTTLLSREPLVGGVKATVDMSPELSTRAKRYLADHRGQSTRQVLIALFDAFLKAKGY